MKNVCLGKNNLILGLLVLKTKNLVPKDIIEKIQYRIFGTYSWIRPDYNIYF